jgi:hypothetical protein
VNKNWPGFLSVSRKSSSRALTRLVREFKRHRAASLLLVYRGAIECVAIWCHVLDADRHHVTTARFAVDRQVEQREVPFATLDLQLGSDRSPMAQPEGRLGADKLALVPRWMARGFSAANA